MKFKMPTVAQLETEPEKWTGKEIEWRPLTGAERQEYEVEIMRSMTDMGARVIARNKAIMFATDLDLDGLLKYPPIALNGLEGVISEEALKLAPITTKKDGKVVDANPTTGDG